jgi:deoxyribodipyrimidine photolyase-like uncharacterized protein
LVVKQLAGRKIGSNNLIALFHPLLGDALCFNVSLNRTKARIQLKNYFSNILMRLSYYQNACPRANRFLLGKRASRGIRVNFLIKCALENLK